MRIPLATARPRFYVATTEKHAFSSWDTLEEALACITRFREHDPLGDLEKIQGVIQTGPTGRSWAHTLEASP